MHSFICHVYRHPAFRQLQGLEGRSTHLDSTLSTPPNALPLPLPAIRFISHVYPPLISMLEPKCVCCWRLQKSQECEGKRKNTVMAAFLFRSNCFVFLVRSHMTRPGRKKEVHGIGFFISFPFFPG